MSERCHICGPVKHEAPTVICAPCALTLEGREHEAALLAELIELRILRTELQRFRDGRWLAPMEGESKYATTVRRHIDDILALAPSSGCAGVRRPLVSGDTDGPRKADSAPPAGSLNPRAYDPRACPRCGSLMLTTSAGERCIDGCA